MVSPLSSENDTKLLFFRNIYQRIITSQNIPKNTVISVLHVAILWIPKVFTVILKLSPLLSTPLFMDVAFILSMQGGGVVWLLSNAPNAADARRKGEGEEPSRTHGVAHLWGPTQSSRAYPPLLV